MYSGRPPKAKLGFPVSKASPSQHSNSGWLTQSVAVSRINTCRSEDGYTDTVFVAVFAQFLLLGTITVILNSAADVVVALFAGPIGERLLASRRARRDQQRATGAAMIGLEVFLVARET